MRKTKILFLILLAILLLLVAGIVYLQRSYKKEVQPSILKEELTKPSSMKISSPAFENNQFIPVKYTCDGEDINPPLQIENVPQGTKSLVLIVDDPDAPMGVWSHWVLFNINPSVQFIDENSSPEGAVEGLNDFKKHSYGGPCPPSGTHHYYFRLYALDTTLDLSSEASREDVLKAIKDHILGSAELIGLYQR